MVVPRSKWQGIIDLSGHNAGGHHATQIKTFKNIKVKTGVIAVGPYPNYIMPNATT